MQLMKMRHYFWMLGLLVAGAACSGGAGTEPANVAGTTGGTANSPESPTSPLTSPLAQGSPGDEEWNAGWPKSDLQLSPSAVQRAQTLPGCIVLAQGTNSEPRYTRRSFDMELGLLREQSVGSEGASEDPSAANPDDALYWRWDGNGRLLMKAGALAGNRAFRHSYERDEHDNVTAFLFTYSDALDLDDTPDGELYMATYYRNAYGSDGLLTEHRVERNEGPGGDPTVLVTYQHDEQGRCQRIESTTARQVDIEQREYDEAGRVKLRTTDIAATVLQGPARDPIRIVESRRYDDQGRLVRSESDGESSFALSTADGVPDAFTRRRYYADGSKLIESLGFTGDLRGDEAERDGVLMPAWHQFEFWSAGCQEVEANIPAPASLACSTDD
jgi:hypothetical protein